VDPGSAERHAAMQVHLLRMPHRVRDTKPGYPAGFKITRSRDEPATA
jgi:hypothetical protein